MKDRAQGLGYLARMNGTKYLVSGNHDLCSPVERDGHLNVRRYLDAGFDAVVSQAQATLPEVAPGEGDLAVLLNHFPMRGFALGGGSSCPVPAA
ncbi:hypothetical protein [Nesterenkonia pannonica]|uniref:hypothetical protein n=1 Tax=Nesterenkonia pannonica TaxID=1548602 RepID=UPI002164E483|nr:hypothetical protein [Nesterenkonia pannonica]